MLGKYRGGGGVTILGKSIFNATPVSICWKHWYFMGLDHIQKR